MMLEESLLIPGARCAEKGAVESALRAGEKPVAYSVAIKSSIRTGCAPKPVLSLLFVRQER